jgi:prolyl-tRNA synthetase
MKDAYSFHASKESLDDTYNKMYEAYSRIFERCGLNFRAVIADSGAIGGKDTHEFMVLSDIGEDTIAYSDTSSYAANIEMAAVTATYEKENVPAEALEKVETPTQKSIEEVSAFLGVEASKCIKSLLFKVDDRFVLVLVRGDHEVNDIKVKNYFEASIVELASEEETKEITGCEVGFLGPVAMSEKVEIIADHAVQAMVNAVSGANEAGYHYKNVNPDRDFQASYTDIRFIQEGDPSPDGQGVIKFAKGIEVGHVFKLGTKYSEAMDAKYLDENGRMQPMIMGCYGIGISRTVAAIAEQFNDENGLVWPAAVAPYHIHLIPVNMKNDEQKELGEKLYNDLLGKGYEVLMDDRAERPGVKFADSDLIGIPVRVTIGKRAAEGIVEVKVRSTGESMEVSVDELTNTLSSLLQVK